MPFCYAPWTSINVSPTGYITPCCKFNQGPAYNIQTHTLKQYLESSFLKDVKRNLLADEWPRGCDRCRVDEENGIQSKREHDIEWLASEYSAVDLNQTSFITASVSFGNACNLKCVMCGPTVSSAFRKEHKALTGEDVKPFLFKKTAFEAEFFEHAPSLKILEIPGGEPFLSGVDSQKELLNKYVESGQSCSMSLRYTTNATIFPDKEWWELWKHFKVVNIQVSIDGIEERFEYIRYPAKWNDVVNNVIRYKEKASQSVIQLCVSHAVSAYNIFYLPEFLAWCRAMGLRHIYLGRVHDPIWARPSIWPQKKQIVDKLSASEFNECHTWAALIQNTDDSQHYELFRDVTARRDKYRGCSFERVFPELYWGFVD